MSVFSPGQSVRISDLVSVALVLRVRSIEGNVLELEACDGSFYGYRHVSSVVPVCTPPAAPALVDMHDDGLVAQPVGSGGECSGVAALFVRRDTHYAALGCDCYDLARDALTWRGGSPGVFHPPCRGWGRYAHRARVRPGEVELALWAVDMCRRWGGVVEHPLSSRLWRAVGCSPFGVRDAHGGVLIRVRQSWWGHRAPKDTGLYVCGPVPALPAPVCSAVTTVERMGRAERERTPLPFARFLVALARGCA